MGQRKEINIYDKSILSKKRGIVVFKKKIMLAKIE